jgi:hypothetical protein
MAGEPDHKNVYSTEMAAPRILRCAKFWSDCRVPAGGQLLPIGSQSGLSPPDQVSRIGFGTNA